MGWQRATLPVLGACPAPPSVAGNVTALTYHLYRDPVQFDATFFRVRSAFLMTRLTCGALPCVLVVNRVTPEVEAFCAEFGVRLDFDPTLAGGIRSLSLDYICKLHARFDTEYVLGIHGDGFPLRRGLEAFVGPYDYLGAPWGRPSWYTERVFPYPRYCVGNGGFSLRSRRLCELAAWAFRRKYRLLPYCYALVDDVFYCRVLPRFERTCRRTVVYAPPEVAGRFAFESNPEYYPAGGEMPLGFHGEHGFARLMADHGAAVARLLETAEGRADAG